MFSRAFNGSISVFGNVAAARTADEYIQMSSEPSRFLSSIRLAEQQHAKVVQAFAKIDEESGLIGDNLGIRAYADTSGTLGLKEWETQNDGSVASLNVGRDNESRVLSGQSDEFGQIFIGSRAEDRVPNGRFLNSNNGNIYFGEGGQDELIGSIGSDILVGGSARDFLTGRGGADTFVLEAASGGDVILDFDRGENDMFGLSGNLTYTDLRFEGTDDGQSTLITQSTSGSIIAEVRDVLPFTVSSPSNFDPNFQLSPFGVD